MPSREPLRHLEEINVCTAHRQALNMSEAAVWPRSLLTTSKRVFSFRNKEALRYTVLQRMPNGSARVHRHVEDMGGAMGSWRWLWAPSEHARSQACC